MGEFFPEPSFQSWSAYGAALRSTGSRFRQRVFARSDVSTETGGLVSRSHNKMTRTLNWWDLMWWSVGAVIGAGIFVLTGEEARNVAGPAIILSYVVAGISAMLSVFCYTEFSVEVPVAGGSFAFLRVELGDFIAFLAAGNLILEYVIGQGAVARGWTSNFGSLINVPPHKLRIHVSSLPNDYNMLDPIAAAVVLVLGIVGVLSTRATSTLNWIASSANMLVIGFVIIAGLTKADISNYTPFLPYGTKSIFTASTVVYFAYLGFDAVATMAEETKNPGKDIPIGLLGSMIMTTIVYCLMALTLCLMQSYEKIDVDAPFAMAFRDVGWKWAQYIVALGALKATTTALLVGSVSQARYITHIARTHMIPPWFAHVHPKTKTPVRSTICLLVIAAVVAFFTSLSALANLLSISTLCIFNMVSIALLVRRHFVQGLTPQKTLNTLLSFIFVVLVSSIGIAMYWRYSSGWIWYCIFVPIFIAAVTCIQIFVPKARTPKVWGVPLVPWLPCASIAINIFLLGSIDTDSYIRFGVMTGLILIYYLFLGLHASFDAANEPGLGLPHSHDEMVRTVEKDAPQTEYAVDELKAVTKSGL